MNFFYDACFLILVKTTLFYRSFCYWNVMDGHLDGHDARFNGEVHRWTKTAKALRVRSIFCQDALFLKLASQGSLQVAGILIGCDGNRGLLQAPGELLGSFPHWLHSAVVPVWASSTEVSRAHGLLHWSDVTDGDREKMVSASIMTRPKRSLSPPDKRAGLLLMMSSGRIWKVKVSYSLFFWRTSLTWPTGFSERMFPYGYKR